SPFALREDAAARSDSGALGELLSFVLPTALLLPRRARPGDRSRVPARRPGPRARRRRRGTRGFEDAEGGGEARVEGRRRVDLDRIDPVGVLERRGSYRSQLGGLAAEVDI